ncbi:1-phosphatidylinositol 4,5-bisphosphate phosphodiesterase gamma-1 [Halotydeus destructor]|nr:1-phosphatidylinositol 4,5-bisphosphate phosphodiesterase gamma-1 [Halotydeus destructor]
MCGFKSLNSSKDNHSRQMEQLIQRLERGCTLTRLHAKSRPERRTFIVKRDLRQIIWYIPVSGKNQVEGHVDFFDIKEIRHGQCSKTFERCEDSKKWESSLCFVILYGSLFRLKDVSCVASGPKECEQWIKVLKHLVKESNKVSYPVSVDTWLRREFSLVKNGKETVSELKSFVSRLHCKLPTNRLKELAERADSSHIGEITFDGFKSIYKNLICEEGHFENTLSELRVYSNEHRISMQNFAIFLHQEQNDPIANDVQSVTKVMRDYLSDRSRDNEEPFFTVQEFVDFLFSKQNEVWDSKHDQVNQDMDRPLAHYWIASSHNTYLTGDQFRSESTTEAYVRCLRMGCRCLELDCWDGPDGYPVIYHGRTLTTKIKFIDVVKTIKEHAFIYSEFPIILSIENHCSIAQQRNMATAFRDILGDELLIQQIDKDEISLPSPNKLKRKFIIKHKKLRDDAADLNDAFRDSDENDPETDISNAVKNGILFIDDDKEWKPHVVMLTRNKIFYAEDKGSIDDDEDADEEAERVPSREANGINGQHNRAHREELHYGEKWYHGRQTRDQSASLLRRYTHLGDGAFLVRDSESFPGDHSLVFLRKNAVNHCHIKTHYVYGGRPKFCLIDTVPFDTLFALISHYQSYPLRSQEFEIKLTEPVPLPNSHEDKDWYHSAVTKAQAEDMLKRMKLDGAFLVRPSEHERDCFAISFRAENLIKHCRIKQEGRLFAIGSAQFESLVELVTHYERSPLYRRVKLKVPVNRQLPKTLFPLTEDDGDNDCGYVDTKTMSLSVKALYDYSAQRDDELTFSKNAIINDVNKPFANWWKGDHGVRKQCWFPANHVQEIAFHDEDYIGDNVSGDAKPLGVMQKGSINIVNCSIITNQPCPVRGKEHLFRIKPLNQKPVDLAAPSKEEMDDWVDKIRDTSQSASKMIEQRNKLEKDIKIARELWNLIIYCRAVDFQKDRIGNFTEMSSFPEVKIQKWVHSDECKLLMKYHRLQLSRIYPRGSRIDSSNYDPVPFWNLGVQMVALNYQTADRAMQLNQGKFRQNANCGYILRPDFMFHDDYDANNRNSAIGVEAITLSIKVIGARHLTKSSTWKGVLSPFVEIEIAGADYDCSKTKTNTVRDNGLNPCWLEDVNFTVHNPDLALIRFVVNDEDMFGDVQLLGQACYPVKCLRPGYRSVILSNGHSNCLEFSSLLIHLEIKTIKDDDEIYSAIHELKDRTVYLGRMIEEAQRVGNEVNAMNYQEELERTQNQLELMTTC